jgi:peptide/nickel transport system substrate-binding protein
MKTLLALVLVAFSAGAALAQTTTPPTYEEVPFFADDVAKGDLPPIAQRLPDNPAVAQFQWQGQVPGKYSKELDILMSSAKDTRYMVFYGYARLVGYDAHYNLVPDILESFDVQEGRIFTFHLRKGHKWSDGSPFTTEDFRYYWEDVANNSDLSPVGPPRELLVDGEAPKVEVIDKQTIRYTWSKPNAEFLPALARADCLFIFRPSKYLKKFHVKYADKDALAALVKEAGSRNWAALHNKRDNQNRDDNPKLPTLDPWVPTTKPPADRFVFKRNPYYYRVDPQGHQLPYFNKVAFQIVDSKLIAPKAEAGETMLQGKDLRFADYTFLKEGEKNGGYYVLLWRNSPGSNVTLYPNLTVKDPVWRALNRDVRFRRALSLAIDRHQINQVVFFGLAKESANTVLAASPLFKPDYQAAYAIHDVPEANRLLDEIGLTKRDDEGFRLLPDGRPLTVIIDTSNQTSEESDVLELISDDWAKIGVRLFTKPSVRDVFRNRVFDGSSIMSVWTGLENGLATADSSPAELAPDQQQSLQWSAWGQYWETGGKSGEAPDMPKAKELMDLMALWRNAADTSTRQAIWDQMLDIYTDQVFTIGTVANAPWPIVISAKLHNVPREAVWGFAPGAYFGIYRPDLFWMDKK